MVGISHRRGMEFRLRWLSLCKGLNGVPNHMLCSLDRKNQVICLVFDPGFTRSVGVTDSVGLIKEYSELVLVLGKDELEDFVGVDNFGKVFEDTVAHVGRGELNIDC